MDGIKLYHQHGKNLKAFRQAVMAQDQSGQTWAKNNLPVPKTLDDAVKERNLWVETALEFSKNEDYYRGLLDQIAASFGVQAFTADDGSILDSPLRAKLPELVQKLCSRKNGNSNDNS